MDTINFITNIEPKCIQSQTNQYYIEYIDKDHQISNKLVSGDFIWEFYKKNNSLNQLNYNLFNNLSKNINDTEINIDKIKDEIINKIKLNKLDVLSNDNSLDMYNWNHDYPSISYLRKINFNATKLHSDYLKMDFEKSKVNQGSTFIYTINWNNFTDIFYFIKSINFIDNDQEIINSKYIKSVEFFIKDNEDVLKIKSWYGDAMLTYEKFDFYDLFPVFPTKKVYQVKINSCINIDSIYFHLFHEKIKSPLISYYKESTLQELYLGEIKKNIEIITDGYFIDIRIFIREKLTKQRVNTKLIKKISLINDKETIINDLPISLLKINNGIIIFNPIHGLIEENNHIVSNGFLLQDLVTITLSYFNKLNDSMKQKLELGIYGKKHIMHNINSYEDSITT